MKTIKTIKAKASALVNERSSADAIKMLLQLFNVFKVVPAKVWTV